MHFVAVHGGAGFHSRSSDIQIKQALRKACSQGLTSQTSGGSCLNAVEEAITTLEDDGCLNAGYGSNLTIDGTVECDASIMDAQSRDYGSVGAVSGVKNPIKAAHAILRHSRKPDPLGRILPMTLVSNGARKFAVAAGVESVPPESMISPKASSDWQKWKARLDENSDMVCDTLTLTDPFSTTPPSAALIENSTPSYLKSLVKYDYYLVRKLETAVREMWFNGPYRPEWLAINFHCFLTADTMEKILEDFHLVTTKDILKTRLGNWKYWEHCGEELWSVVDKLRCEMLETRKRDELEKQQEMSEQKTGEIVRIPIAPAGLADMGPVPPVVPTSSTDPTGLHNIQDTVGAVTWDLEARLAAGVSSGGLLLKNPGRIGEAAVFGAGCWAQQATSGSAPIQAMACSISGAGEYITRESLAQSIARALELSDEEADTHEILRRMLTERIIVPARQRGKSVPNAGVLLLTKEVDETNNVTPRLWCAFTTPSMAVAYASSKDIKPKATILRQQGTSDNSIFITALPLGKS